MLVGGPQVGYFFPEFFMEVDLHGGGYDVRGALLPGLPLVVVGRGVDFAWTVTSSQGDNIDMFAETPVRRRPALSLQGRVPRDDHAGRGNAPLGGAPDQRLTLLQTVHGVVQGYATVNGRRVALAQQRSTRGREVLSALGVYGLNTGQVTSPRAS